MSFEALDTETTGLDAYRGHSIFAWSTCDENGHVTISRYDTNKDSRSVLQAKLNDDTVEAVSHNMHFDKAMCLTGGYQISAGKKWHCSQLAHQVIYNLEPSNSIDDLAYKYGGYPKDQDLPIKKAAKIYGSYDKIPKYLMNKYQHGDAERCMLMFLTDYPRIRSNPKLMDEYNTELALVDTTIRMEMRGIMLCREKTLKLKTWLENELIAVAGETLQRTGRQINLNSPKQVIHLLYEELGWPVLSLTNPDDPLHSQPSTDKDALEELRVNAESAGMNENAVALLDVILKQRSYTAGLGMINSYLLAVGADDILHPHINTCQARTSRESSENPNMQNVRKEKALKTRYPVPARECFRARPGYIIFTKDYSGIEMTLAVQATRSSRLIKLLEDKFDFHDACAKSFYGDRYLNADRDMKKMLRSAAKNGRFAMLYGAGLKTVAITLGLSLEQAQAGYEKDKREYPEFYDMMDDCIREAYKQGYIETFFGRRLYVNKKKSYTATDYKIQGSAAGLFKRAQIRVDNWFKDYWCDEVAIWLPVHDELIMEVPRTLLKHTKELMTGTDKLMTEFDEITVPLRVETKKSSYTWAGAIEYKY
jgi:DNA polymerase I